MTDPGSYAMHLNQHICSSSSTHAGTTRSDMHHDAAAAAAAAVCGSRRCAAEDSATTPMILTGIEVPKLKHKGLSADAESCLELYCGTCGLHSNDFDVGADCLDVSCHPGDQTPATHRHEDIRQLARVGALPQDLLSDGALSGYRVRIVIGRHKHSALLLGSSLHPTPACLSI